MFGFIASLPRRMKQESACHQTAPSKRLDRWQRGGARSAAENEQLRVEISTQPVSLGVVLVWPSLWSSSDVEGVKFTTIKGHLRTESLEVLGRRSVLGRNWLQIRTQCTSAGFIHE